MQMDKIDISILEHLNTIYNEETSQEAFIRLSSLLERNAFLIPPWGADRKWHQQYRSRPNGLSERDAILITYGDQVKEPGKHPLHSLAKFCERHLTDLVNGLHILPFSPSSSDDGFAVIDYRAVDPALGNWEDVTRLGQHFKLMFDAVVNHVSTQNVWFQSFLRTEPKFRDYFIVIEGNPDLSQVVRPRALPLLTRFETSSGSRQVWTTFSADQVDLNYQNPDVLLAILGVLLFYVAQGAEFIRLDAIAYLWKEIGTSCIHLPQTHHIIQLMRAVLDVVAPHVMLITETNVPHAENVSYFGDGTNEAQMVYNFALPPLVLHTLQTGSARVLSDWAVSLSLSLRQATFFNFLASHDGIGLNPVRGILSQQDIDSLAEQTITHGGLVSYKHDRDGSQSPYELNINYFDALSNPYGSEPIVIQVDRFIAAQAIMLSLPGVPGIYFHSLFGSRGWLEGVRQSGQNRTINRQKLELAYLENELDQSRSLRQRVFHAYARLLKARTAHPAFHPFGDQRILDCGEATFAVLRLSPSGSERVLCLQNVSSQAQSVAMDFHQALGVKSERLLDLISRHHLHPGEQALTLSPYQTLWLVSDDRH